MSKELSIRRAGPGDARAIAELHVRSWRWAYRGLLPDEYLAGLSVEKREASWSKTLSGAEQAVRVWCAERGGRLAGFAATGPQRDEAAEPGTGEVYAIYLDRAAAGTGAGRALFTHAVDDLRARGFKSAVLWVLDTNARARRFYEAAGWRTDGATKQEGRGDLVLHEVRYRVEQ